MIPIFTRIDSLIGRLNGFTEDEAEMIKHGLIELALAEPDPDDVASDGRDYTEHAADALKASGVELKDGEGDE